MVDELVRGPSGVNSVTLRFAHSCDGKPAMHGKVRWLASDATVPAGPISPPPSGLWDIDPGVAAGQSYLALEGTAGEYVSQGGSSTYTKENSLLSVSESDGAVHVGVAGAETWDGYFAAMDGVDPLRPGYYPDLRSWPVYNPTRGGLSWSGEGRNCGDVWGWFVVDEFVLGPEGVDALTLRFEQRCGGPGGLPLHGKLRWLSSDATTLPGPAPVPSDLWDLEEQPPSGRSYVALEGEGGTGGAWSREYTKADAAIAVVEEYGAIQVRVAGDERWSGSFRPMAGLEQALTGWYPEASDPYNPARGGVQWTGAVGCSRSHGWFAIDEVTRVAGAIRSLTARFERNCDGNGLLRGKVHWEATDPTMPPAPVRPVPDDLWDAVPAGVNGDYVLLDAESTAFACRATLCHRDECPLTSFRVVATICPCCSIARSRRARNTWKSRNARTGCPVRARCWKACS